MRQNQFLRQTVLFFPAVVAFAFFLSCSTSFGLEFHPDYSRSNPPPSGYYHSDIPGSHNPWTDDIQKTLLEFPASNKGVTSYRDIEMLPEGYTFDWGSRGPTLFDGGTWEFVDLSTQNHLLTGTNWVHGKD